MAKQVHHPNVVANLWASQSQESARNLGNTLFFKGAVIYSYGDHFPIARITSHAHRQAVLMTTDSYSKTTARHISEVRSACLHRYVFNVHNPASRPFDNFKSFRRDLKTFIELYRRDVGNRRLARRCESYLKFARQTVRRANRFAEFFGLKSRLKMPKDMQPFQCFC